MWYNSSSKHWRMLLLLRVGRVLRIVEDWYRATSSLFKCSELSTEDWEVSYCARFSRTKLHFFLLFLADHRRKMAVYEEKYLPFKFPSLLHPASLRHFMVKNSRDDCKLSSCRSPFYFIANTSSNSLITRTNLNPDGRNSGAIFQTLEIPNKS